VKEIIKIAGAGISGLTSAINLAKKGYQVEVYERKANIAHRFKGDFQGIENWTTPEDALGLIKSYNLELNFQITPSHAFKVCGPKRNLKNFTSDRPLYYLIQRGFEDGNLDKGLYQQALDLDIPIYFNCTELPEDIRIFATGPAKASAIILGCNFKTDYENTHLMLCDNDLAPKGYAYLLTVNGSGTIATAFMPDNNNPNAYLERTISTIKEIYPVNMKEAKKFGTYGSFNTPNIYKNKQKFFVGEAAGLQDFLFGFGLRYAMLSGFLAAKSIAENLDYEKLAINTFSNNLKASLVNRFLYEQLDNSKYDFIINRLGNVKDLVNFLRKRYRFGIKRKLLYPVARRKFTKTITANKDIE
jgi:flavin-dependent dehydrogenase